MAWARALALTRSFVLSIIAPVLASFPRRSLSLDPLIAQARRRARKRRAALAFAVGVLAASFAGLTLVPAGHAARGDGTIVGGVVPAGTHAYAAATVTVRNSQRDVVAITGTVKGGLFRLTLPAGRYVLKAEYTRHPCSAHVVVIANVTRHANLICKPTLAVIPHVTFRQKLVTVARAMAHNLGDPAVRTARLYGPASYPVALSAFSDGTTTPNRKQGRFYVIALRGNFVCTTCGSGQSGIWHVATTLWTPTGGDTGWGRRAGTGLRRHKLVASMSRLGRPKLISLR
jgi:hypothetical protein